MYGRHFGGWGLLQEQSLPQILRKDEAVVHGEVDKEVNEIGIRKELVEGVIQYPQVLQPEVVKLHVSLFCLHKWNGIEQACLKIFNSALQQIYYNLRDDHIVPMQDAKNRAPVGDKRSSSHY